MDFIPTTIPDVIIIEPRVFADGRGFFLESYQKQRFSEAGIPFERWRLAQIPDVEGAFVAMEPSTGAIRALVGGYDFNRNKFNRVVQAQRQPGSGFKPFVYSAALEAGFSTASVIDDAPLEIWEPGMPQVLRPENYDGSYKGPMRMREALVQSRNLVSIRLLKAVGATGGQILAAFLASAFLAWSPVDVWSILPRALSVVQFPYRLLAQVGWCGALLLAVAVAPL